MRASRLHRHAAQRWLQNVSVVLRSPIRSTRSVPTRRVRQGDRWGARANMRGYLCGYLCGRRGHAGAEGCTMSSISIVRNTDARIISPAFNARCLRRRGLNISSPRRTVRPLTAHIPDRRARAACQVWYPYEHRVASCHAMVAASAPCRSSRRMVISRGLHRPAFPVCCRRSCAAREPACGPPTSFGPTTRNSRLTVCRHGSPLVSNIDMSRPLLLFLDEVSACYIFKKDRRSAFTCSACVPHIPCGAPA
ncbi:hypothetical protein SAMN06295900_102128 [Trinickia caryophylli]|uniref:Uncharacterized protein n=1 Tax=Trinickia caryophylli TaxID=28094 RepID=A0A1X7CXU4_TRICW|nr:hypothetical protein SAMN06295900_102128 [Trinickia caryophylli]